MRNLTAPAVIGLLIVGGLSGCTVHPQGEQAERDAARRAGRPYATAVDRRQAPPLPADATPDDLVRYALLNNADLEQHYWQWRSAIEQIPQDGTQPTNLALSAGTTLNNGTLSRDRTTLTALNDPMADIVWPEKLSAAARRALENARAAGQRFRKAQFDLRRGVLDAYDDYALTAELIRLEESNARLLRTTLTVVQARNRAGAAAQGDVLKAQDELDLSQNNIANMESQLPALRARLNALLGRDAGAPLPVPTRLPPVRPTAYDDAQLLTLAARQNPELAALAKEIAGRRDGIQLARLQYMPDFSLSAGTDLAGITQTLMGMVTVPLLRYQSINAAIAQAEANLKSTDAQRRQAGNDLAAQVVTAIATLRDADRQLGLFEQTILPRARQAVTLTRSTYEVGQTPLLNLLDDQRSLIALQRLVANLTVVHDKREHELETIAALTLDAPPNH